MSFLNVLNVLALTVGISGYEAPGPDSKQTDARSISAASTVNPAALPANLQGAPNEEETTTGNVLPPEEGTDRAADAADPLKP